MHLIQFWTRVNGPLFWAHPVAGYTADWMNIFSVGPLYFHFSIAPALVHTGWRAALQILLSAHPAPSPTYPTHQTTQTC